MPDRASLPNCSLSLLHQRHELFDISDRRFLQDTVSAIEDVRPVGKRFKDSADRGAHGLPASQQSERVEIALHRKSLRKLLVRPGGIHRLVEPNGADAGLPRISRELAPRAL